MKLIDKNTEKLRNAIIYFSKNTKYCGVTKLMKLLYFLDFIHFRQSGKPVTGRDYFAWKMGPVPIDVYKEITGSDDKGLGLSKIVALIPKGDLLKQVTPKVGVKFDKEVFSERELRILQNIAEIFRDSLANEMIEVTHLKNHPWEVTKSRKGYLKRIDYELALDGSEDQLDPEIVKERQNEIAEMQRFFGE